MLSGVTVPLITPLNQDESLDEASLERTLEHVLAGGADSIFVLGSAGEFPNLPSQTKERMVRTTRQILRKRAPLLVGIGQPSTWATIEQGKRLADLGADAAVVLPPFYFRHSPAEHVLHFESVAEALNVPLIVYNIPQFVKDTIAPETVAQLAGNPTVVGLKNTARDMEDFDQYLATRAQHQGHFAVSQGDLPNAAECLLRGADGITLGVATVAPSICRDLYAAGSTGNRPEAEAANEKLMRLDPGGQSKSWFAGLKGLAFLLGLCQNVVARPFMPCGEEDLANLRQRLVDLELLEP